MWQRIPIFVGFLLSFTLVALDALAEKRVALVIGNSAYKNTSKLANPANDAAAVSAMFRSAGFNVVDARENLSGADMRRTIRDFSDKVRDADIAVVFYAGHGIELDGTNYLIPVDAVLDRDIDVEDETVSLDRIIRILEPAKRLRLVILDACRDNPFTKTMKRSLGTRSVGRGLAKIEPTSSDTLIAFAAKAGSTALDGDSRNSPFTTALLENIATPGLDLRIAFGRVRDGVLKATNNRQEPFVYGSLGGMTVALVPAPEVVTVAPGSTPIAPAPTPNFGADIRQDYDLAKEIGTKGAWEAFLRHHTTGLYADLARQQLAKLLAEEAKSVKAQPPAAAPQSATRPPESPQARSTESKSGGGQIYCDTRGGCQQLKPGCRVVQPPGGGTGYQQGRDGYVQCN